jgi:hypothetical protein
MVIPANRISVGGQHTLQDMVELQMYLMSQTQRKPWPLLPRCRKKAPDAREPYSNLVEWGIANELVNHGFIEATSSRTFVVSKSGHQFYEREIKT